MQPKYKESWVVVVGKKEFVLNEKEIIVLREAMKRNDRWVSYKDFIISVPHIECIYLDHREIANQLPEGQKKEEESISEEKWREFKETIYKKIGGWGNSTPKWKEKKAFF